MAKENKENNEQMVMNEADGEQKVRELEKSTLQQLKEMEQVSIHIPHDPINEDDNTVIVGVNGVFWPIPRGKETKVPLAVKQVYDDSYARTREVEKRMNSTDKEVK